MKAVWQDTVLAESDDTVVVENNHYFPMSSLKHDYFSPTKKSTFCPWKGKASYFSITVDEQTNTDAAWYYPEPFEAASKISDRVAFWKGVQITD